MFESFSDLISAAEHSRFQIANRYSDEVSDLIERVITTVDESHRDPVLFVEDGEYPFGELARSESLIYRSFSPVGDRLDVLAFLSAHVRERTFRTTPSPSKVVVTNIYGDPGDPGGKGILFAATEFSK